MFALPVILIFTILLITIQIPIICTLYYSQNYMLKMLSIKLSTNMQSHPLRVRGLKQASQGVNSFTESRILYGFDTSLFQSVQIIIVSTHLGSSFHDQELLYKSIIINKIQTTTKRKCHYSSIDCSYVIYLF